jgi:hypothetical protein
VRFLSSPISVRLLPQAAHVPHTLSGLLKRPLTADSLIHPASRTFSQAYICLKFTLSLTYKARHGFLYIFAESSRLYLRNCSLTSK